MEFHRTVRTSTKAHRTLDLEAIFLNDQSLNKARLNIFLKVISDYVRKRSLELNNEIEKSYSAYDDGKYKILKYTPQNNTNLISDCFFYIGESNTLTKFINFKKSYFSYFASAHAYGDTIGFAYAKTPGKWGVYTGEIQELHKDHALIKDYSGQYRNLNYRKMESLVECMPLIPLANFDTFMKVDVKFLKGSKRARITLSNEVEK